MKAAYNERGSGRSKETQTAKVSHFDRLANVDRHALKYYDNIGVELWRGPTPVTH